jgi:hypothetical protein
MKPVKKGRTLGPATQIWGKATARRQSATADREGHAPTEHTGDFNMGFAMPLYKERVPPSPRIAARSPSAR